MYVHVVSTCDYKSIVWSARHVCMRCVHRNAHVVGAPLACIQLGKQSRES